MRTSTTKWQRGLQVLWAAFLISFPWLIGSFLVHKEYINKIVVSINKTPVTITVITDWPIFIMNGFLVGCGLTIVLLLSYLGIYALVNYIIGLGRVSDHYEKHLSYVLCWPVKIEIEKKLKKAKIPRERKIKHVSINLVTNFPETRPTVFEELEANNEVERLLSKKP